MKAKRKYYQIFQEFEALPFDANTRLLSTLRAAILEGLATHGFRDIMPKKKERYGYEEDVLKLREPEAEIKYGLSCNTFYLQTSVSDEKELALLHHETVELIKTWEKKS
jgi:hypothetical protein